MQSDVLDRGGIQSLSNTGRVVKTSIGEVALPDSAEKAFDGIGGLKMLMHRLVKRIQGEQMLFVLRQTSSRLGIVLCIRGF